MASHFHSSANARAYKVCLPQQANVALMCDRLRQMPLDERNPDQMVESKKLEDNEKDLAEEGKEKKNMKSASLLDVCFGLVCVFVCFFFFVFKTKQKGNIK